MSYQVNFRDLEFNLFDYLKIQELGSSTVYSGFGRDEFSAILQEALKFAQKEIDPLCKISDTEGCRIENGQVIAPTGFKDVYRKFAQNGFLAMDPPTTYGGQGLPFVVTNAANEFFIGACVAFTMYSGLTRGAGHLLETFGSDFLKEVYVPKMYSGEWGGTMCLTEPQAGSAVGDISTTATPEGDHYKIKGGKIFISSGDHDLCDNIIHMVLARIEGDPAGTKGISLFVVPKIRVEADGSLGKANDVKTVNIEHKMGIKGSSTCTLSFGDQDDCIGYLLGEPRRGMAMMFQMMNEARVAVALQGQAVAGAAYESALRYAQERIQGNNTAIIAYPDVRRMLITQKAYVEGMRALTLYLSYLEDQAKVSTDPKQADRLMGRMDFLVPVAKGYCTDMGFKVTELALQTYGGYGYISEYPVEQYMRDIKIASIYEGTNGIQALDLIGRKLSKNAGQLFREFYEDIATFCGRYGEHQAFKNEISSLKKTLDELAQVTMKFGEWAMSNQWDLPQLHCVPYLYNVGDVCLGWLLMDQAIVALEKLESIWQSQGATEEAAKSKICEENEEARFLEGKVKTARFFIHHLMPQARARAKSILSGDDSAMKIRF